MDYAREHLILGTSTLTIRLMPGEYTLTSNTDLYHPQGSNIIIEGDPSSFRQRTLWRVQDYTWSLPNFAGGGHTGTISLFDGATTSGCTFHGFTAANNGTYFSIVNAALGSRSGYYTVGTSATGGVSAPAASSYDPVFYGDRFFNHGFSYEDGNAVLGIGRILSAGISPHTLNVEFSNLNYDGRCPAWHLNGGLGNATPTWAGLANNYPETQYSQPNGYYGSSGWRNENGNVAFPPNPSVAHITPDPFVVSTYPVVIRANYGSNVGTLYLKNGALKGLRNIMFASGNSPYTLFNGVTGATANHSQAISAFTDNGLDHDTNGVGLYLENATIGIRHLGFNGLGTAISAHGSKITKYSEQTVDTGSSTSPTVRYATLNSLDNAPVLCTSKCANGIVAKNTIIDFTDGSGTGQEYLKDHCDASVYVSALSKPVALFGSELKATTLVANTHSMVPSFKMDVVVPLISGLTSTMFVGQAGKTGFWSSYPLAKAFVNVAGSGRQELGAINFVTESASAISGIAGSTVGVTYIGATPAGYRRYTLHGLKTAPTGLNFMTVNDVRNGITTSFGTPQYGGTLEVEFYSNNSGSAVSSYYAIGRNCLVISGSTGTTYSVLGSTSGTTFAFVNYVQSMSSYGTDGTYLGNYFENRKTTLQAFDGSSVMIEKALVVDNGGAVAVEIAKNSSLIVGDGIVSANKTLGVQGSGQTDGTVGAMNYNSGSVCITGYAYSGVHCWDNSNAVMGTLFTKHPTAVNCFEDGDLVPSGKVLKIEQCSRGIVGNLYSLLSVGNSSAIATSSAQTVSSTGTGHWKSRTGVGYGFAQFDTSRLNGAISVEKDSSLMLELSTGGKVFHHDGGSPVWAGSATTARNASLLTAKSSSTIMIGNVKQSGASYANSGTATSFTVDGRTASASKIATRSSGSDVSVYGTSNVRVWAGLTSTNISVHDVNIGNYITSLVNSNGEKDVPPPLGVTYCSSFNGFSRILGI